MPPPPGASELRAVPAASDGSWIASGETVQSVGVHADMQVPSGDMTTAAPVPPSSTTGNEATTPAPEPVDDEQPAETLAGRIAQTTRRGGFKGALPPTYTRGGDWETIGSKDPFERLYLDRAALDHLSDAMVRAHGSLIAEFWSKTVEQAEDDPAVGERLAKRYAGGNTDRLRAFAGDARQAATTLATDDKRRAIAHALDEAQRQKAAMDFAPFVKMALLNPTVSIEVLQHALNIADEVGIGQAQGATLLVEHLVAAGYRPLGPERPGPTGKLAMAWTREAEEQHEQGSQPATLSTDDLALLIRERVAAMASPENIRRILGGAIGKTRELAFQGAIKLYLRSGEDVLPDRSRSILDNAAKGGLSRDDAAVLLVGHLVGQGYLPIQPLPDDASPVQALVVAWSKNASFTIPPLDPGVVLDEMLQQILIDSILTPDETDAYFTLAAQNGIAEDVAAALLVERLGLNVGRFVPAVGETPNANGSAAQMLRGVRWLTVEAFNREAAGIYARQQQQAAQYLAPLLRRAFSEGVLRPEESYAYFAAARDQGLSEAAAADYLYAQLRAHGFGSEKTAAPPLTASAAVLSSTTWISNTEERQGKQNDGKRDNRDLREENKLRLPNDSKGKEDGKSRIGLFGGLGVLTLLVVVGLFAMSRDDPSIRTPSSDTTDVFTSTASPAVEASDGSPIDRSAEQIEVTSDFVNLRDAPTAEGSNVVTRIGRTTRLHPVQWYANCESNALWAEVDYNGARGWVSAAGVVGAPYASAHLHPDCQAYVASAAAPEHAPASLTYIPDSPSAPASPSPASTVDRSRTYASSEVHRPAHPQRAVQASSAQIGRNETVQVDVVVGTNGAVESVERCSGTSSACTAAIAAVQNTRFVPASLGNTAVASRARVAVRVSAEGRAYASESSSKPALHASTAPSQADLKRAAEAQTSSTQTPTFRPSCAVDAAAVARQIQRQENRCPRETEPIKQAACLDELSRLRQVLAGCSN